MIFRYQSSHYYVHYIITVFNETRSQSSYKETKQTILFNTTYINCQNVSFTWTIYLLTTRSFFIIEIKYVVIPRLPPASHNVLKKGMEKKLYSILHGNRKYFRKQTNVPKGQTVSLMRNKFQKWRLQ